MRLSENSERWKEAMRGCLSGCAYCKAVSSRAEVTCSKPQCLHGGSYPMRYLPQPLKACDEWALPEEKKGCAIPFYAGGHVAW